MKEHKGQNAFNWQLFLGFGFVLIDVFADRLNLVLPLDRWFLALVRDHLFPCFCATAVLTALWQQESSGMRKADRLFQIIQILRRSSRPVTSSKLANELEVARRTVYRDIAHLIAQRVPIEGEAGFGYVLDPRYDMPPLMLTPEEIEAVALGVQMVARLNDAAIRNAASDVMAKITSVMP